MRPRRASSGIGQARRSAISSVARGAGQVGIVELVEGHEVLGDGPGDGDLAVGVAGDQPGLQPGPGPGGEPVAAAAQHPADAVERVAGAAAVPGLGLLDAAADVIDGGQGEAHDVERVEHPHRVGQLRWSARWRSRGTGPATPWPPGPPRLVAARPASRPARVPERPSTTSSSRAARPGVRSAIPVANVVDRVRGRAQVGGLVDPDRGHRPASRAGSSTTGVPRSMTWRITVHHATPSAAAVRDTAASAAPTCSNAHARARSVSVARGAIASCRSVQVRCSHSGCGQHQIRLTQQITTGRPPIGRSRTQVGRRSFARATAPHAGQPTRSAVVSHQQLQLPAGVRGGEHLEPGQPEQGSRHRRRIVIHHLGPFTLVVTWS